MIDWSLNKLKLQAFQLIFSWDFRRFFHQIFDEMFNNIANDKQYHITVIKCNLLTLTEKLISFSNWNWNHFFEELKKNSTVIWNIVQNFQKVLIK